MSFTSPVSARPRVSQSAAMRPTGSSEASPVSLLNGMTMTRSIAGARVAAAAVLAALESPAPPVPRAPRPGPQEHERHPRHRDEQPAGGERRHGASARGCRRSRVAPGRSCGREVRREWADAWCRARCRGPCQRVWPSGPCRHAARRRARAPRRRPRRAARRGTWRGRRSTSAASVGGTSARRLAMRRGRLDHVRHQVLVRRRALCRTACRRRASRTARCRARRGRRGGRSTGSPAPCSGAMYAGVPMRRAELRERGAGRRRAPSRCDAAMRLRDAEVGDHARARRTAARCPA